VPTHTPFSQRGPIEPNRFLTQAVAGLLSRYDRAHASAGLAISAAAITKVIEEGVALHAAVISISFGVGEHFLTRTEVAACSPGRITRTALPGRAPPAAFPTWPPSRQRLRHGSGLS
jgi:hypothetical protein